MESNRLYKGLPCAALVCAFAVADGLIQMPLYSKSIIPLFAAAVIGVPAIALVYKPLSKIFSVKNRIIRAVFYTLFAAFSLSLAYLSAREYTAFIYEGVLVGENMFFIKLIFALCVLFFALCENSTIYKFSVLSVLFAGVIFIVLFFTSFKTFDIKNLQSAFGFKDISIRQIISYLSKLFLPIVAAVLFIYEDYPGKGQPQSSLLYGALFGISLTLIVLFDAVLSFGLPLAAKLNYPYIDDISTVTVGSLFTRMDGFAYFAFFVCYILKCGVALKLSSNLICCLGIKSKKVITMLLSAVILF